VTVTSGHSAGPSVRWREVARVPLPVIAPEELVRLRLNGKPLYPNAGVT